MVVLPILIVNVILLRWTETLHIKFYVEERHMPKSQWYVQFVIGMGSQLQIVEFTGKILD